MNPWNLNQGLVGFFIGVGITLVAVLVGRWSDRQTDQWLARRQPTDPTRTAGGSARAASGGSSQREERYPGTSGGSSQREERYPGTSGGSSQREERYPGPSGGSSQREESHPLLKTLRRIQ